MEAPRRVQQTCSAPVLQSFTASFSIDPAQVSCCPNCKNVHDACLEKRKRGPALAAWQLQMAVYDIRGYIIGVLIIRGSYYLGVDIGACCTFVNPQIAFPKRRTADLTIACPPRSGQCSPPRNGQLAPIQAVHAVSRPRQCRSHPCVINSGMHGDISLSTALVDGTLQIIPHVGIGQT